MSGSLLLGGGIACLLSLLVLVLDLQWQAERAPYKGGRHPPEADRPSRLAGERADGISDDTADATFRG